mgnify:CR=1 FL=1
MESFATLIKSRKSTRKFTDQLLNPEQVEMILKAALMAPASKRKNPWQFVVVEDKEMLAKLSVCKPAGAAFLKDCALAVVVLANVMESDVWVEDASIASIYMQLQAEDLGLGSCWCQIRNRQMEDDTDAAQYVRGLLDVPYQLDVLSIICNGKRYISELSVCQLKTNRGKYENHFFRLWQLGDALVARNASQRDADRAGV